MFILSYKSENISVSDAMNYETELDGMLLCKKTVSNGCKFYIVFTVLLMQVILLPFIHHSLLK